MKKHCTFGKKSFVIAIEMLSVLGIVGIICFLFTRCIIVTDNKNYSFLLNPFESKEYEESDSLAEMFDSDSADMIYYLALCQQFETNGEFDEEKTIDILSYYYRKQPGSTKVSSNGELVYKIQDLINWGNTYGISVTDGTIEERYYPVDGASVYGKDLYTILEDAIPDGISSFEQEEIDYEETNEEYLEETGEETVEAGAESFSSEEEALNYLRTFKDFAEDTVSLEQCAKGMEAVAYLNEIGYFPEECTGDIGNDILLKGGYEGNEKEFYCAFLNEISSYIMREEKEASANPVYSQILSSVIYDLCINYERYQDYKDYFVTNELNFKYLYLPEHKREYYSNLKVKNIQQAEKMAEYFNNEMAAYVIIEPATKNVLERSNNVTVNSILPMLDQVGYSFQEGGGTVYLGVLKENIKGFSDYDTTDHYAAAQRAYDNFRNEFRIYLITAGLLFLIALIAFVLYSCMCGNKAWYEMVEGEEGLKRKLIVSQESVRMKYFDGWFTEIAFCTAVFVIGALLLAMIYVLDVFFQVDSGLYLIKNQLVLIAVLIYVAILNGCFLFFYGSLIRRIKTGTLWKGSLLAFCFRKLKTLLQKSKGLLMEFYYRRGVVARICILCLPVILANVLLIMIGTAFVCDGDMDMALVVFLLFFVLDSILLYLIYKNNVKHQEIIEGIEKINSGEFGFQLDTKELKGDNLRLAKAVNNIGTGIKQAVETSMKDERLKADLITNVSHDIKTPLTSIINYVDLLKRENVQDATIKEYIEVLDVKSQRLKQLTEDLVEASKISSGNITLVYEKLRVVELMNQIIGEFSEKFQEKKLDVIANFMDKDAVILADGRRMWRVFENLFGNIYKYAMPGTRVYLEIYQMTGKVHMAIKNISAQPLNINAEELTERFIRGDISRSTEGSGLGLSIAKSLVQAQNGEFKIYLDGDLFKITIIFNQETEE